MTDGGSNPGNFVRRNANSDSGTAQQNSAFMFSVSNRLRHLQSDIRVKHRIVGENSVIVNWDAFALQMFNNLCLQLDCGVIRTDGNWSHVFLFAHFPFSGLIEYSSL